VKDLVDVVVIARTTSVDADRLTEAVTSIFERRDTHGVPPQLPAPPSDWARPWSVLVEHLPADPDLSAGAAAATAFWDPVLAAAVAGQRWEPGAAQWRSQN
jgi:hypothetical protein